MPGNGIGQPLEPELQELQELHELQALHPQRRQPQELHPQEEPLLLLVPATELPQPQDVAAELLPDWLRQQGLQQEPATKPGKISP